MNKIFLQGRIVKGPKASMMANGKAICHFDISVRRAYRKEGDEPKYDYFKCVAFRGTADLIASRFGRGDYIIVAGPVYDNNYESDGRMNYGKQVVVDEIDFPNARRSGTSKDDKGETPAPEDGYGDDFMDVPEGIEEELPFV
jgi:single-strand DNA-binding protein